MRRLAFLALAATTAAPALAYAPQGGSFVARDACPAVTSLKRGTNPGNVTVQAGTSYKVRALNRQGGDQVELEVPGAEPPVRWVALGCGELRQAEAAAAPTPQPVGQAPPSEPREVPVAEGLLPFFDRQDGGRRDPAPPPPALDAFDRAVLTVCGPWGSRPRQGSFRRMLDEPALQPQVEALHAALDGRVYGPQPDLRRFKDELSEAWFADDGFAHIFCGEPGRDRLGGLHYAGRYLELQLRGLAGRLPPDECRAEIDPPVYTVGVAWRNRDGEPMATCPKGYALGLSAMELMQAATLAFRDAREAPAEMCLAQVEDEAGEYMAVLVHRDGIRTFYPDASPRCDGGGPARSCRCGD